MSKDIAESENQSNPCFSSVRFVQQDPLDAPLDALVVLLPKTLEPQDALSEDVFTRAGLDFQAAVLETVLSPKPGDVVSVPGFDLKARHVFLGIVPLWRTDFDRQDKVLLDICAQSIVMAKQMKLQTLGFPLLQGGKHGYPKGRAVRLITNAIERQYGREQGLAICIVDPEVENLQMFQERMSGL